MNLGGKTGDSAAGSERPERLSAGFVKRVKEPGRYGDGRGSYGVSLLVKKTANGRLSKTFSQRILIDGSERMIGMGPYPLVTLVEVKDAAVDNARLVRQGKDPRPKSNLPTFAVAANHVIENKSSGWREGSRTRYDWEHSLAKHVVPKIGHKRLNRITRSDVLAVLRPIWAEIPVEAQKVRRRMEAIMKWAVSHGMIEDNPAGPEIVEALPSHNSRTTHRRAQPQDQVGVAIMAFRASGASPSTKLAYEFMIHTASRPAEALGATWDEIETGVNGVVWIIPAERMKTGCEHRVPLSRGALAVLERALAANPQSRYIFPSPLNGDGPLARSTLTDNSREQGIYGTPHGFRSTFRDWCGDTEVPREHAEAALAHVVGGTEGAYARTDYLELRRPIMQRWSDFVETQVKVENRGLEGGAQSTATLPVKDSD